MRGKQLILEVVEQRIDTAVGYWHRDSGEVIPVWIPYGVIGDTVKVQLGSRTGGGFESRLLEVVEATPHGLKAKCVHFGKCGGCLLQHVPYETQTALKEQLIDNCLGAWMGPQTRRLPLRAAPNVWEYRSRMDYSFWQGERGEKRLGMLERGSSRWVADLHECHLTPPWFMDAVAATRDWWLAEDIPAFQPHLDQGALRRLTLREGRLTGERMAILTVSTHYEEHMSQEQVERWAQAVGDCSSVYLQVHRSIKGTPTQFPVTLLRGKPTIREIYRWQDQQLVFEISPHAFAQPNHAQAEQIYNLAWELASVEPDDLVYDLYCGTGAFACYAGLQSRNVLGIESCQQAVEDARRNAAANGLSHVRFEVGDVGKMLQQELPKPDLVVVDPPRPGLGNAVTPLLKLAPERLVYVSCNPRSQAIDVARLIQEGGYRLDAVAPVDQFPHTSHVENICLLVRS